MYKHEGISKVDLKTIGLENFGEFALQVHEHTQRGVPLRNKEILVSLHHNLCNINQQQQRNYLHMQIKKLKAETVVLQHSCELTFATTCAYNSQLCLPTPQTQSRNADSPATSTLINRSSKD